MSQKKITVGTPSSPASLDTNFKNAQDNFTEVYPSVPYSTIVDLRASSPISGKTYSIQGHTSSGDGGGGDFLYVTGAAPGTYVDNNGTVIVPTGGNGSAAWIREYSESINVLWFGPNTTPGTTNMTSIIQAAIVLAGISGGGTVLLPPETCEIESSLLVEYDNVKIIGHGRSSVLSQGSDFGTFFSVGHPTTRLYGFTLDSVYLKSSVASLTSGEFLLIDAVSQVFVNNITLDDAFVGISLKGVNQSNFTNILCLYESDNGGVTTGRRYLKIGETSKSVGTLHSGDVFFSEFNGRCGNIPYCDIGIEITSGDGIWFDNFHVGNCITNTIFINANSAIKCTGLIFRGGWVDIGTSTGVGIQGSTPSQIGKYYFRDSKFLGGNAGDHGFDISGSATEIYISDNDISNWGDNGILIRDTFTGSAWIENNTIRDCSQDTSGNANGISFNGDSYLTIQDNTIFGIRHARHIFIEATSKTISFIDKNYLVGAVHSGTVKMSDLAGTDISQKDNIGYNPRGSVSVAVTASPWTYTNTWGFPVEMQIRGGTISNITKDGIVYNAIVNDGTFMLDPGKSLIITYSSTPFVYIYGH